MIKNIIIVVLVVIIVWLGIPFVKGKTNMSSIKVADSGTNEDVEFYKYLNVYKSLLPEDKYKIVDERIKKVAEEADKEDSKIQNTLILTMSDEIKADPATKDILAQLKKDVADLVKNSKIDKDTLFSKNTECAKLTSNIKDELSKKYKNTTFVTEKEELNFIFYSPSMNTCLYTTDYSYDYSNYNNVKSEYYTKKSDKIYDVSSNKQLGDYPSWYWLDPSLSKEEADKAVTEGQKSYAKYIFENSGYNAKLLKDIYY
ncbi:MAG: hypothetical protein Q7R69_01775 [bacterium]|nr:hypothetical protein [bacterium]